MGSVTLNILLVYSLVQVTSNGTAGFDVILTPAHRSYCTSQNLTISCTITNYHGNKTDLAKDLTFTYNNEPVDPNSVTIVNGTTAEFLVTGKHPTKNFFYVDCCLNTTCSKSPYPHGQLIHSYVMPEPVQNLTCLMHDVYEGPIHCSWVYGVDYTSSWTAPRVYFIWRLSDQNEWNTSHAIPLTTSSYALDVIEGGPSVVDYPRSSVGVNVTSTECGYTEVVRNFYRVKIVQLSSIGGLHGSSVNSSCVILTWTHTIYKDLMKMYNIHCDTVWNITKDIQFTTTNQTEARLCDLIPATDYNCSVRVKLVPDGWKASRWSPDQSITVKTLEDVPGSSPTVTASSFAWDSKDGCTDRQTITGSVWIYWKPIPPIQYNGIMKGTVLTYNTGGIPVRLVANISTNYAKLDMGCQETHVITLHAENNKGFSVEKSLLTIPPRQAFSGLVPELIVEKADNNPGSRYIEWSRPKQPVNGYTVFYAVKKPLGSCTSELISPVNWKFVSGNQNSTIITVNERSLHCFGISVQTDVGSSGISWTDCVNGKQKVPSPPVDVGVTLGQTENTLRVSWGRRACSPDQPYITSYQVAYCPSDPDIDIQLDRHCKESLKIVTCPGSLTSMTLDNLTADEYKVNVRAVTRFNVHGNWSLPIFQHTGNSSVEFIRQTKNNLTGGEIAAVVVASIIILGFAVLIPYCFRRCKKRMYNLKQDIDIPIVPHGDQELHVNSLYQPNAEVTEPGLDNLAYTERSNGSELQRNTDERDNVSGKEDNEDAIRYLSDGYVELHLSLQQLKQTSRDDSIHGTSTVDAAVTDVQDDVDVRNEIKLPLSNPNESEQESTNDGEDDMVRDYLDTIENKEDHKAPRGTASSDMSTHTNALPNIVDDYVYTENVLSIFSGQAENGDSLTVPSNHEDNMRNMCEYQTRPGTVEANPKLPGFNDRKIKYAFDEVNKVDNKSDHHEIEIGTYSPCVKAENFQVLQISSVSNVVSDCGHNNTVFESTPRLAQHSEHMVKSQNDTSSVTSHQLYSTQPSVQKVSGYIDNTTIMVLQKGKGEPETKPAHMNHQPDMLSNNTDDNPNVISGYVHCKSCKANVPSDISPLHVDQQPDMHVLQNPSNNYCIGQSAIPSSISSRDSIMKSANVDSQSEIPFGPFTGNSTIRIGYIDGPSDIPSSLSNNNSAMDTGYIDQPSDIPSSPSNNNSITVTGYIDQPSDIHSSPSDDNSNMDTGYIDQSSVIDSSPSSVNSTMVTGYIEQPSDTNSSPLNVNSTMVTGYIAQPSDIHSSPSKVNSTMVTGYIAQPSDIHSSPSKVNSTMVTGYIDQPSDVHSIPSSVHSTMDTAYIDQPSNIHSSLPLVISTMVTGYDDQPFDIPYSPSNNNSAMVTGYIDQPFDIHSSPSDDNSTIDTGYIIQPSDIHYIPINVTSTPVTGYIDQPPDVHSSQSNVNSTMVSGYIDQSSDIHSSPSNVISTLVTGYIDQPSDIHSSPSSVNSTMDNGYIDLPSNIHFSPSYDMDTMDTGYIEQPPSAQSSQTNEDQKSDPLLQHENDNCDSDSYDVDRNSNDVSDIENIIPENYCLAFTSNTSRSALLSVDGYVSSVH